MEALTRAGRLDQARLAFEKILSYANHVGLYAEQIAQTGEQLGNFPQAFTQRSTSTALLTGTDQSAWIRRSLLPLGARS